MIEGINVLNKIKIMTHPDWAAWLGVVSLIIGLICLVITLFCDKYPIDFISFIIGMLALAGIAVGFLWPETKPTGHYKYECTIDESVSMTEVYEKYRIVEQRGDIWVLEDKKND